MEKEELAVKLQEIVSPYTHDKEALANINPTTNFLKDLKINSANLVDIVLDVEEEFGIEIEAIEMERMLTIEDTVTIIKGKLEEH